MKFAGFALALAGIFAGSALGQTPTVGGLLNNYSFTLPGLPNYGIAEGSIFDIYGTNMASAATPLQNPPLQSTLNGVTINVTVNGTTTHPLFYYLSATQIDAVLPSATPVGTGTITVTTSAGTSAPFPITVVQADFGLLTQNNGSGPVAGFNANNNGAFLSFTAAANPGEILELWGTGLGPVPDDATLVQVTNPVKVYIGGVPATVQYAGRSSYEGLDQLNVYVPDGVLGCYNSVDVVTGSFVSNFGTVPVAAKGGRTCSEANSPLTSALVDQLAATGSLSLGVITVGQLTMPGITVAGVTVGGGTTDTGSASFSKITSDQINQGGLVAALGGFSSAGSCFVDFFTTTNVSTTNLPLAFQFTTLNAGPDVNVNGPDGLIAMALQTQNGVNSYSTPIGDTSFIPATGGAFTFNNGGGGPDVGAFTTPQVEIGTPVAWSNAASLATVTRSNGMTVNWTGGTAGSNVNITGFSLAAVSGSTTDYLVGFFSCQAPASAGTYTVPPAVLLSLPVSSTLSESGVDISLGFLLLSNSTAPVSFTATGLDLGLAEANVETFLYTAYQ
jgi:uncharacterized protein (TIGR03437 family)